MLEIKLTWTQAKDLQFICGAVIPALHRLPGIDTGVITGERADREYRLKFTLDGVIIKLSEGGKDNG